jgi:hypothetical protein
MPFLHDAFLALLDTFWWQLANCKTNIATGSANNANLYNFLFQWGWQEWQKVARAMNYQCGWLALLATAEIALDQEMWHPKKKMVKQNLHDFRF